jgi:hypothetical protein
MSEGAMMSDSNDAVDPSRSDAPQQDQPDAATDDLEGSYTEVDGESPHERTVEGEYTRTDGAPDEEPVEGDYTSTEEHPDLHPASEEHGEFTRTEPPKPHPGSHRI